MAEHPAVNRGVASSSLARGATFPPVPTPPWDRFGTNRQPIEISLSRDSPKLPAPTHLQSFSQFFISYVQVALRLLNARVSEHQLDDADVDAVGEQAAGALVAQVVPP